MPSSAADSSSSSSSSAAIHPPPPPAVAAAAAEDPTSSAPVPIDEPAEDYSRRYTSLLQALEVAVRKGSNKFSWDDFRASFPLQCALDPAECRSVWLETGEALRARVAASARARLEDAGVGPGLALVQRAVRDARERAVEGGGILKGDEWVLTTGLSPQAMSAAYNLPLYDAEHARLTAELAELNADIATLSSNLAASEARSTTARASAERQIALVQSSLSALDTLDVDELSGWMETVLTSAR